MNKLITFMRNNAWKLAAFILISAAVITVFGLVTIITNLCCKCK